MLSLQLPTLPKPRICHGGSRPSPEGEECLWGRAHVREALYEYVCESASVCKSGCPLVSLGVNAGLCLRPCM